jgi:hypothetical protein
MAFAGVTEELEKHPLWIALAVVAVALLAFIQRGNSGNQQSYTFAGGGAAAPIDPNAAAIEEASISAGSTNFATLASLIGLEDSNRTALTGSLAQTSAARDVAMGQTSAARDVSLAGIAADEEVQNARTSADIYNTQNTNAANVTAAQITAGVQRALIDSQTLTEQQAIQAQENVAQFQTQASKDIARAGDNTSIINGIVHVGEDVLRFFFG